MVRIEQHHERCQSIRWSGLGTLKLPKAPGAAEVVHLPPVQMVCNSNFLLEWQASVY